MIKINTDMGVANICETLEDLPEIPDGATIFCDVETTSGDPNKEAFNWYAEGIEPGGWAITWNDHPEAYYIPIRNNVGDLPCLGAGAVSDWLIKAMRRAHNWVNHNIKFDMHFLQNDLDRYNLGGLEVPVECTQVLSSLLFSDRHNHKLKDLCRDWCGLKMAEEHEIDAYLKAIKSKDFGDVPIYKLGKYAAMDVFGNRALWLECLGRIPDDRMYELWKMEQKFTYVLFDMERQGMKVDSELCKREKRSHIIQQIQLEDTIKELSGIDFIDSPQCMEEIICNQLGLPILEWNWKYVNGGFQKQGPKFDADVLKTYAGRPDVIHDEQRRVVLQEILKLRQVTQNISLYLTPFLQLKDKNGFIHPSYRQTIRTGRLACGGPNIQQANKLAATLLIPRPGYKFACPDGKQAEFRVIVHYAQIKRAIKAFLEGDIDYHQFVADICEIGRDDGKTLNFAMAFTAGKKRVLTSLISSGIMGEKPEDMPVEEFMGLATERANGVWERYHSEFPEISGASRAAADTATDLGYVVNIFGRRRYLKKRMVYRAFNAVVQSTSSDIVKQRMIETSPRFNPWYAKHDVSQIANKHDEVLFEMPEELNAKERIVTDLTDRDTLRVPISWDYAESSKNWKEAKP